MNERKDTAMKKQRDAMEALYIEYTRLMEKAYKQLEETGRVDEDLDSAIASIEIDMEMLQNAF